MYGKSKNSTVPSDAQAREKLALYVYEYLLHVGAQKAAQTFLSEIRWEKNITLGEPPGFLHSWWCVFWDLYCAAPERRDQCDHSSEAKAFHDYGFVSSGYGVNGIGHNAGPAPSPLGQMPPNEGMGPGGPMGSNFFPVRREAMTIDNNLSLIVYSFLCSPSWELLGIPQDPVDQAVYGCHKEWAVNSME